VPIIAVPGDSLVNVHTARFKAEGILGTDKMYYPKATREFYEAKSPQGVYRGKKILALHGAIDQVVPPDLGADDWFNQVVAEAGPDNTERDIQAGMGHICTPEMVGKAAEWFYRWGVARAEDQPRSKL
jgi:predicted esterase